jgi:bacterioferritin
MFIHIFSNYSSAIINCKEEDLIKEFFEHAEEEHEHALLFADILKDIGGNFVLETLEELNWRSDCKFKPMYGIFSKIKINIDAERCAINSYIDLLKSFNFNDKHKRIINGIIADEEQHIRDLDKLMLKYKEEIHVIGYL